MADLVRFHNWIFDRNEIVYIGIEEREGTPQYEFELKKHSVTVHLKNEKKLNLICPHLHNAREELDYLTAKVDPELKGKMSHMYLLRRIIYLNNAMNDLAESVNKLMKRFSTAKKKIKK